jgi:hypothetical protein
VSTNDFEATHSPLQAGDGPRPHHGYDPNQPRVPAGHSDSGQWTRTGGSGAPASLRREAVVDHSKHETWGSYVDSYRSDGTLAEQRVFNRDGSRIVSEFNAPGSPGDWDDRHTVVLADGSKVTFQTSGDVQEVYDGDGNLISASVWTKDGPQSLPVGQLAFVGPAVSIGARVVPEAARAVTAAGLALFAWLSSLKDRDGTAVFAFKAAKYEKKEGPKGQSELSWVGYVKRDELKEVCEKLDTMQELTDAAVKKVREDGEYDGPADFGTKVHKMIADIINSDQNTDPDFKAEVSAIKSELEPREDPNYLVNKPKLEAKYGQRGTVRFDAYENRPKTSTVCVYDPKTGKRGLSFPRMTELAAASFRLFHYDPQQILVIEVRPGQGINSSRRAVRHDEMRSEVMRARIQNCRATCRTPRSADRSRHGATVR